MSSTTDTPTGRGQVLVIFALSLTVLILFAALAFDTGQILVEKRDQQNAADAAAVAGSHFLPDAGPYDGDCAGVGGNEAARAACDIADANGFEDDGTIEVEVHIPPTSGVFTSANGAVEVIIRNNRPSIFAGIMGVAGWDVSARAVAVNQDGVGASFAMLALEPEDCDALLVSGNGTVNANGNIQVNSDCDNGALKRSGGGTITVTAPGAACNVHGDIKDVGSGELDCTQNEGAPVVPDPLTGLPGPDKPDYPSDVVAVDDINDAGQTLAVPNGCPGAVAPDVESTETDPVTCQFQSNYQGTTWRLFPGYYPGGIQLQGGSFYWEPGIYWIGGGGVTINGNGTTSISVATGGNSLDYGILLYNTEDPEYHDWCAASATLDPLDPEYPLIPVRCIQPIHLDGASASIDFYSLNDGSPFTGLVIYQDRSLDIPGDDVIINGSASDTQIRGTMYVPSGDIRVNGSGGTMTTDQVIANTFTINGAPGSVINVLFDTDFIFKFTAAGLVE